MFYVNKWWARVKVRLDGQAKKGLNSIIILVSLMVLLPIWLEPYCLNRGELVDWGLGTAKGISFLLALVPCGE
jgi:hypothetical protein